MEGTKQTPYIVILPFAKQFVHHHYFSITFTIPTDGSPTKAQKEVLDSLLKSIDTIFLSPVKLDVLSKDTNVETRIYLTISRFLSSLREAFKVLTSTTPIAALAVDLFGSDAFDVAKEFNVLSYIFLPSTSMLLSLYLHLPKLDEMHSCEYRNLHELVKLPDVQSKVYTMTLYHSKHFRLADGILLNSFTNMEAGAINALKEDGDSSVSLIYLVGPLIQNGSRYGADISGCLNWLNNQYVVSLNELALGLELSKQRFLWVVKSPNTTYLGDEGKRAWKRMRTLKDAASKVLSKMGSSRKSLSEVACKWKSQVWL
ncbi:hypothetical protein NE237_011175 [Protea cynaroides]|uniref:Uncharacterized protein n=1 Tax=Protea cynaroides TaxID=273540 RepID=A0A9Q0JWR9_9MAGN|nr:hypothetical protein NE237_011175 [Protea cynaroides]